MIFAEKESFGVVDDVFLGFKKIAYLNLCRVETPYGVTIGNATSIGNNKKISLKKSYSEYLERFSLGMPMGKEQTVVAFDLVQKKIIEDKMCNYGYGDTIYGHNDTTGTASGTSSTLVIDKALCELIEKNECLCFWYSNVGKKISVCGEVMEKINRYNFISEKILLYIVQEVSNYPTVIALGLREKKLIASGVACTRQVIESIQKALDELRVIEWQQYQNRESIFCSHSEIEHCKILDRIYEKEQNTDEYFIQEEYAGKVKRIKFAEWVKNIQIKVIYADDKFGLKTVKCISNELLSSLPIQANIEKANNKEVVKRYYNKNVVNCPIV